MFIDGTKLEACANKYTFVWKKSIGKWEEKMLHKIQESVKLLNREYLQSFSVSPESRTQDLQDIVLFLEERCRTEHTVFVHGRGKRKSRNQRYFELFHRFLERQTIYDWHTASFQGRNNYCKTDPDATFMHMKDDHMRNAQLKPGYNVQIAVDSEYIVATDIFQDRNDVWTLVPFLKTMERNLGFRYPSVTADSGYESEEAYTYLRSVKQKPYIKPQTYEKWKKRLYISKSFLEKRQESYENILSKTGIQYRTNRSIQVEGAFGVLKHDYEFQRCLLRGKNRVKLEILLLCMGYNINKLHAKIQKERLGSYLFPVKETA